MKISISFSELQNVLGYVNTVLSDKSVDDKIKNVIFLVSESGEVQIVAYNALTFCRTVLEKAVAEGIHVGGWEFQVKAGELNKIVSSFSNMYRTHVDTLDFEESGVRIRLTVHEVAKEGIDSKLSKDSMFELENAPILSNINKEIKTKFPENQSLSMSNELMVYINAMFGIMANDSSNSIASKLNFAEDYVFCMSNAMSAFMVNKLPDDFKNVSLGYSSVSFLKKICEGLGENQGIGVAKTDLYICVESGNTQAFMRYKPVKINYKMYVSKMSKDKGIVIDRLYFKDVLKRMGNIAAEGKLFVSDDENITVQNDAFSQEIPLNGIKEGTVGTQFKFSVSVLEKLILGSDDAYADNLFIYFVDTMRGYIVYVSDKSGVWFANTQVSKI